MNYFSPAGAAERYSRGRPDVHAHSIARIKEFLHLDRPLPRVLDVACGTGLSTKALLTIAEVVYATDISVEMLRYAPHNDRIHYTLTPAEELPFDADFFPLLTVSSGVHWFDIEKFIIEARRVLVTGGWLVLYENYFDAVFQTDPGFAAWWSEFYKSTFPSPPRNTRYPWTNENLGPKGLHFVTELKGDYSLSMTKQQLALYFTTQSNVIARVEAGQYSFEEVEDLLLWELTPFFPADEPQRVGFGNWVKVIQKPDQVAQPDMGS
jgi:ubiquinone/menaquinone biosynthesis C-methylase UbiE